MSHPHAPSKQTAPEKGLAVEQVFDVDDATPYETQRTVQRYLSQETRHNILQVILGHPAHLVSVTEFDYYIPKSRSTISEQLEDLATHEILMQYHYEPNAEVRDVPADFWGLTEFGVSLLTEYNYLRGLPIMRAAHDATHKTETVQRHEDAPRPSLPASVNEALEYDGPNQLEDIADPSALSELQEQTFYADAAPADPSALNEDAEGDRTLDELFD
ncbi:hypothetical protein [Halosimplex pelagicum]|uniref:Uncharacterized protein n=1 Tax=Halosimplex pelagicum TaxID=869886 RepID=A0A7D5P5I2_9EURY|nr:hypothetical protein [Halosimplex pelagicum]QLH81286.1 hypothetical protein HZS54_06405 [Halosimplex pelagicum]